MSLGLLVLVAAVGGAPVPLSGQEPGSVGGRVVTSTGELLRDATVSGRISGRVVDLDGSGGRASLVLHRLSDTRVSSIAAFLQTAPDGRYALADLPPGNYLIEATVGTMVVPGTTGAGARPSASQVRRAIALAAMDVRRAWYPGVTDRQTAATLTLGEGEHATDVDIWIPSQPRAGVVGQVAWPVGVHDQHVALEYGDPTGAHSALWVVSDPEGHFVLSGVGPGPLVLMAYVQTETKYHLACAGPPSSSSRNGCGSRPSRRCRVVRWRPTGGFAPPTRLASSRSKCADFHKGMR
jgi:hypothetical protein